MHDEYVSDTFTHKGLTIKIIADNDPMNPREDCCNAGTMVCWHSRYILGDEQRRDNPDAWFDELVDSYRPGFADYWDNDMYRCMIKVEYDAPQYKTQHEAWQAARAKARGRILDKHYIMLPLRLYDHSGISMYVGSQPSPFDPGGWDSGQVGWIYVTRDKAIEEWAGKGKRLTRRARELAVKCLEGEVETYNQYLTGDVYGYVIEDETGEEVEDGSCWGFFGEEYCKQAAIEEADAHLKWEARNIPAGDIPLVKGREVSV